jgi:protein lin-52
MYSQFTELGNLPKSGIITEIKRLYDEGYQLGLDEGKEITRGKYLNIFAKNTLGNRKK